MDAISISVTLDADPAFGSVHFHRQLGSSHGHPDPFNKDYSVRSWMRKSTP